jgi:hypothetical protein
MLQCHVSFAISIILEKTSFLQGVNQIIKKKITGKEINKNIDQEKSIAIMV